MSKIEIDITGMTCGHCAMSVNKELSAIPNLNILDVSFQSGKAVVQGEATEQQLAAAIEKAGYQASKFVTVND